MKKLYSIVSLFVIQTGPTIFSAVVPAQTISTKPIGLNSKSDLPQEPLMLNEASLSSMTPTLNITQKPSQEVYENASKIDRKIADQQESINKIIQQSLIQEGEISNNIDTKAKNFSKKKGEFQAVVAKLEKYLQERLAAFTQKMNNAKDDEAKMIVSIMTKINQITGSLATFKIDLAKNDTEYKKILELQSKLYQNNQTLHQKQAAYALIASQIRRLKSNINLEENIQIQNSKLTQIESAQINAEKIFSEIKTIKNDLSIEIHNMMQQMESSIAQLDQHLKEMESNIDEIAKIINQESTAQEALIIKSIQEAKKKNRSTIDGDEVIDALKHAAQSTLPAQRKMFDWIKKYTIYLSEKFVGMVQSDQTAAQIRPIIPATPASTNNPLQKNDGQISSGAAASLIVLPPPVVPSALPTNESLNKENAPISIEIETSPQSPATN